jgi:hypothetical protein
MTAMDAKGATGTKTLTIKGNRKFPENSEKIQQTKLHLLLKLPPLFMAMYLIKLLAPRKLHSQLPQLTQIPQMLYFNITGK